MDHHINKACWLRTFSDEFDDLYLWSETGGVWKTSYQWGNKLVINNELQYYVDPRLHNADPFHVDGGVLTIEARRADENERPAIENRDYTSGLLTTEMSFAQRYGYFEVSAQLPAGKGLWPAAWLLPSPNFIPPHVQNSAEIDILELLGHDPTTLYTAMHSNQSGELKTTIFEHKTPDLSADFHTYGLLWTAETLAWYLDGNEIARTPTADDMHVPMYLQLNLAVGGEWPGNPDKDTVFPAHYRIDYVRVYRSRNAACAGDQPLAEPGTIDTSHLHRNSEIIGHLQPVRPAPFTKSLIAHVGSAPSPPSWELHSLGYAPDADGL